MRGQRLAGVAAAAIGTFTAGNGARALGGRGSSLGPLPLAARTRGAQTAVRAAPRQRRLTQQPSPWRPQRRPCARSAIADLRRAAPPSPARTCRPSWPLPRCRCAPSTEACSPLPSARRSAPARPLVRETEGQPTRAVDAPFRPPIRPRAAERSFAHQPLGAHKQARAPKSAYINDLDGRTSCCCRCTCCAQHAVSVTQALQAKARSPPRLRFRWTAAPQSRSALPGTHTGDTPQWPYLGQSCAPGVSGRCAARARASPSRTNGDRRATANAL
jgi:hypothetical protein